jgi:tol-pal system protein YbgF
MFKRSIFAAVLLASAALPASAQDIATRLFQMEERIRQLTGQVEELTYTVNQLQQRLGQKQGDAGEVAAPIMPKPVRPQVAVAPAPQGGNDAGGGDSGIEVIEDTSLQVPKSQNAEIIGSENGGDGLPGQIPFKKAGVESGNGEVFQGQVVVPENSDGTQTAQAGQPPAADGTDPQQDGIQQVALQPPESPDELYKMANEALLRRQFGEAEAGFRSFLSKYPDHSLAGSAQYWLGETFYVQGDSKQAAQNFLQAYKTYPKSRRAPDSLLKLGMALNKLGQKEQACAALGSVETEFPRAVEAKKRASAEFKRAGC